MDSDFFRKKNREIQELLNYNEQIDICFLDIQMKGMDGMETARKLMASKFRGFLIFITVLKEIVFQSFEVQAYDYLVKPVDEKQFERTMERLYVSMQSAMNIEAQEYVFILDVLLFIPQHPESSPQQMN